MAIRLFQANLNHCRKAQDLWLQSLAAGDFGLGVAAKPWRVPESSNWYSDTAGSVAILFRDGASTATPLPVKGWPRVHGVRVGELCRSGL
jgi:hypothetical protein